jgi:drug/metabolite transporter (DMT)-like permease
MSTANARVSRTELTVTELGLVAMALIWGVNFSVLKYGTEVMEPLAYNGVRMFLGALTLLAVTLAMGSKRPAKRDIGIMMLLGVLGHGVYQALFIQGIARTRAGTASLMIAASPAFIAIVGRMFGVERVTQRQIAGIAMSIGGLIFVIVGSAQSGEGHASVTGDLMVLGAVFSWAFYTTWVRPLTVRIEGLQIAAWTLVGGTIPILLLAAPAMMRTHWAAVTPLTWGAVCYSGIGSVGIAYLAWYRGVRVIGSTRTAMFSNLQPIVAVAVAWPLLGERPTAWQGVGAAGVLAGLWLSRSSTADEPAHGE